MSCPPSQRNLDTVPGLAYYAAATEGLGGGISLAHAQMFALAGLYEGQLARVRESNSWISRSGQVVRLLLQTEGLSNNCPLHCKEAYRDAIKLTAWSTLQLESDILAELDFPSSGLPALSLEPYDIPDCGVELHGMDGMQNTMYDCDTIVLFYSAQTYLRISLNNAHREIFGKLETNQPPSQIREMLRGLDTILTEWRMELPPNLRWEDDDQPPADILHARLQAKYWGARYITTRSFLDYVMHIMPHVTSVSDVEHVARDAQGEARDHADLRLLEAIAGMPRSGIWAAVESCIKAAIQSTVTFDGIPDRAIVTNIHGTAHAQFGNMLVPVAVYRDERLQRHVPREQLRSLLDRTVRWLGRLAPISRTCRAHFWILHHIRSTLSSITKTNEAADGTHKMSCAQSESTSGSEIAVAHRTVVSQ